ncbi:MAG: efflux transporter outer membrane subunit [Candidatus Theseobacter exili]|nr:efflux transporter outer membrane subunit [Candidatus Theseobacter exili]
MIKKIAFCFLAGSLIYFSFSCASFRPDRTGIREGFVPGRFSKESTYIIPSNGWWLDFNNNELSLLIEQAFNGNLSLVETSARLQQAKAQAVKAGASLIPEISIAADTQTNKSNSEGSSLLGGSTVNGTSSKDFSLGLSASYELDLWGRIRALRNSAVQQVKASQFDLETAEMTLSAEVANIWLKLLEKKSELVLLNKQLQTNKTFLSLLELRWRKSMAAALDVFQQKQIVAATEALLPQAESELIVLKHQLAVLLGKTPTTAINIKSESLPQMPPFPDPGLPAKVLNQRPDVQASYLRLLAADWNVAAAKANRFPALRLSGSASYDSENFQNIFDNWFAGLAASLTAPVLDGKRRASEVDLAKGISQERLAQFRQILLNAIKEVEDALIREEKYLEYLQALERELQYSKRVLTEAQTRYRKGSSDYLPVLTALGTIQKLERQVLSSNRALLSNRINLYRALGGTWMRKE